MSMSSKEVIEAKRVLNNIVESTDSLLDVKNVEKGALSDDNFLSFLEGTSFGAEMKAELNELMTLISGDLYQKIDSMNQHTYNFLSRQEDDNNNLNGNN